MYALFYTSSLQGEFMANPSAAGNSFRATRRSTRRDEAVLVTVSGVDARRGPYTEKVSTLTISCHGCKYPSKYQVLPDAMVTLELHPEKDNSAKITTRGRVKWIQRDSETGGPLYTAVEFENPQNIWKIPSPPEDWLQFAGERKRGPEPVQPKPVAVLRREIAVTTAPNPERAKITSAADALAAQSRATAAQRSVGHLMGDFQQQMEEMIADAAVAAVRDKAAMLLNDVRSGLRDEAKRVLIEIAASQAADWAESCIKEVQRASQESTQALHARWTKRIEAELGSSFQRIEDRHREAEMLSTTLVTNALDRLHQTLETIQQDAVERIVARLKDRLAPSFQDAREVAGGLAKRQEEIEKTLEASSEKSSARIEQTCERLEKQFEVVMRARLDEAREELERTARGATASATQNISASAARHEKEAQARLSEQSDRIAENAKKSLEQMAAATSNEFAAELTNYSRGHLEFVSSSISDLAKGIGKRPKS
jgi:PilZ domain